MTRQSQKSRERFYTEQAIKSLGKDWIVLPEERENRDFIVADGEAPFGLQVISVFAGGQGSAGSSMKKGEPIMPRSINARRDQYEASAQAKLVVKSVGRIEPETIKNVARDLIALNLDSEPVGFRTVLDEQRALRLHVTKCTRSDWYNTMQSIRHVWIKD
jgi:hypothetical protein